MKESECSYLGEPKESKPAGNTAEQAKSPIPNSSTTGPRCPDILFAEEEGIYWLRGDNLARAKNTLGLASDQKAVGFDGQTVKLHIDDLTEQGVTVGIIRGNTLRTICRQQTSKPEKVESKTAWLSPALLFGQRELVDINRHLNGNRFIVDGFIQRIRTEELNHDDAIREFGNLYVYQVAEDLYEIDWELTTMVKTTVEALAVAAHQIGRLLQCELVAPKPKRDHLPRQTRRTTSVSKPQFVVSEPVAYGQLRFDI